MSSEAVSNLYSLGSNHASEMICSYYAMNGMPSEKLNSKIKETDRATLSQHGSTTTNNVKNFGTNWNENSPISELQTIQSAQNNRTWNSSIYSRFDSDGSYNGTVQSTVANLHSVSNPHNMASYQQRRMHFQGLAY